MLEAIENIVDHRQRLQLDIGLDLAPGANASVSAISSRVPTNESRMVMQFTGGFRADRLGSLPSRSDFCVTSIALYAGSLVSVMKQAVGPVFTKQTGIGFQGHAGSSKGLAAQISSAALLSIPEYRLSATVVNFDQTFVPTWQIYAVGYAMGRGQESISYGLMASLHLLHHR